MTEATAPTGVLKFGVFELDVTAGELRKSGRKVPLPGQPFALLAALVERPGQVVTRDDLKQRLWPSDTYVDFDRSLNTAASKVREALGDSASSARFIETLPRRGYRFLASVEGLPSVMDVAPKGIEDRDPAVERRLRARLRWAWSLAALGLLLAAGAWLKPSETARSRPPTRHFTLSLPGWSHAGGTNVFSPVISPDSRYIVYPSEPNRKLAVWDLTRGSRRVLEGTDRASFPIWSPDSRFIAFSMEGRGLHRVSVEGGPVSRLLLGVGEGPMGGSWSPDGKSLVLVGEDGLYELPAEGGAPRLILPRTAVAENADLRYPHFLPAQAGRAVLLAACFQGVDLPWKLMLFDLDEERLDVILEEPEIQRPIYSPTGHIVYEISAGRVVKALPFSLRTRRATGDSFLVAENASNPSVANDQTLVFRDQSTDQASLVWIDRQGNPIEKIGQPSAMILYPTLSPDEKRVLSTGRDAFWVHETARPIANQIPFGGGISRAVWASFGREIVFGFRGGIYEQPADGAEEARLVYDGAGDVFVSDRSDDGRYTFYDLNGRDIWYLERGPGGTLEAKSFLSTDHTEKAAQISPDNRWVAYVADDTGAFEVYLRPFPTGDRRYKVSPHGGRGVRWWAGGRALSYVTGQTLWEVEVELSEEPQLGEPEAVLEWPGIAVYANRSAYSAYDVSADGKRFVALEPMPDREPKIRLIQNWYDELREPGPR